jgi:hypothetical protein
MLLLPRLPFGIPWRCRCGCFMALGAAAAAAGRACDAGVTAGACWHSMLLSLRPLCGIC